MKFSNSNRLATLSTLIVMCLFVGTATYGFGGRPAPKNNAQHHQQNTKGLNIRSDIPKEYRDSIDLYFPTNHQLLTQPKFLLKGINRFGTPVFVDGNRIHSRQIGRFLETVELKEFGKSAVLITFLTPDYTPITIQRDILYLHSPEGIQGYPEAKRESMTLSYNTRYFPTNAKGNALNTDLNRADLAYFVKEVRDGKNWSRKGDSPFADVTNEHWASNDIAYAVDHNIMSEFPDGTFRPDRPVNRMEFVITVVRALRLKLDQNVHSLPYSDVSPKSWKAKFVKAALDKKLIQPSAKFNGSDTMSLGSFADAITALPAVQDDMKNIRSFKKPIRISDYKKSLIQDKIALAIDQLKGKVASTDNIAIMEPKSGTTTFTDSITVSGVVKPAQEVRVNNATIVPNQNGEFARQIDLKNGRNRITVATASTENSTTVYKLTSFKDLKGHWVETTAAKFLYLNMIDSTPSFNPKGHVTRAQFAQFLSRSFDLQTSNANIKISDVPSQNEYYASINRAIHNKVLRLDKNGKFYPNRTITRAEAVIAVVRIEQLGNTDITGVKNPFKDITKKYWGYNTIMKAYKAGVISAAKTFNPKQKVARAQLVAMLAKTRYVKNKIQNTFKTDI